ncbi:MAG: metal-sensitive transcriptional regulator, partial [Rickettsiales bacterium]|nr:metal-sensitive transcriptional regulator [Rickettsiales bacterium]
MKDMKNCGCDAKYPSHEKELPRLNRAIGQMEGIRRMIEARRYCPEILIQFRAVKSAIRAIENNILKTHLES